MEASVSCVLCGWRIRLARVATVRVNRRSLRCQRGLTSFPGRCLECGTGNSGTIAPGMWRLMPESAVRVAAYRQRKWPAQAGRTEKAA